MCLQNYPERLGYALILNLPMAFRMGWNMILPFLDERTKAKIHILGPNLNLLKDYIPESELEDLYGGKHPKYPVPDSFVNQLVKDGVLIKTGYFDTSSSRPEAGSVSDLKGAGLGRTFSAGRLDRIRKLLTRNQTAGRAAAEGAPKSIEVPKAHPRVTVLGATARTGVLVVERFLQKTDYDIVAFVRLHGSGGELSVDVFAP